ncbi:MAG: hypothetical protein AAGN35_07675 [Bacteroidota bacterium]
MHSSITTESIRTTHIPAFSRLEDRLYRIFNRVITGRLDREHIRARLRGACEVNLIFIKRGKQDIGFGLATYYKARMGAETIYFVRPALGILKDVRGGIGRKALKQYITFYIQFKMRHPFHRVYIFSAPVSPIVYAGTAKYWRESYPRYDVPTPSRIERVRQAGLAHFGLQEVRPGILKHGFIPEIDGKDRERFAATRKNNPHVDFFFVQNPNFLQDEGLIVIVPVNFRSILGLLRGKRYD